MSEANTPKNGSGNDLAARNRAAERPPVLSVRDLRVNLAGRDVDVVDAIDFRLRRGEILGMVGESGSGKTTTALSLLGYARPGTEIVSGSVEIDGVDLLALSERQLRRQRGRLISYVPQDPGSSLTPGIRIGKQLREILVAHNYDGDLETRITEMLQEVSLPADAEFLKRYPHQLSGGQQQRVVLAMAFGSKPRVVVLDEPTTGLDVTTQARVLQTVRELCAVHGTAAVYVSHDLAVVGELASAIAVMYLGRMIEFGSRNRVMGDPGHPYTRRLIAAIPDPQRRRELVGIRGRVEPVTRRPSGCVFAARCEFCEEACTQAPIGLVATDPSHRIACRRIEYVRSQPAVAARELDPHSVAKDGGSGLMVSGLSASYRHNQVLHDVSFEVPQGGCVALVGESGSGKTTLTRCISGLHAEATGELRLDGSELPFGARRRPAETRRTVQYVFQNPYRSLNPRKTVGQLLEHPLELFFKGSVDATARIPQLLERVALNPALIDRYPAQLSGGERQRVAVARALAADPKLLICDEVTSALDVSVQAAILRLLSELRLQEQLTILFVTHNLAIVRAIADHVVVLNQGAIVEQGDVDEILDHPKQAYTQKLLADTPTLAFAAH